MLDNRDIVDNVTFYESQISGAGWSSGLQWFAIYSIRCPSSIRLKLLDGALAHDDLIVDCLTSILECN